MTRLHLHLAYNLAAGWLGPYVESLMQGRALARKCEACGHVSFPPIRGCCLGPKPSWLALDGEAAILFRTDGADGSFGLVRFTGADTASVIQLSNIPIEAQVGALYPPQGKAPALILGPVRQGLSDDNSL